MTIFNWHRIDFSLVHLCRFPQVVPAQAGWWYVYVKRPKANAEASLQHGWMQGAGSLHRVSLAAAKCQQPLEEGRGSVNVIGSVGPSAPLQSSVAPGQPESSVQLVAGGGRQMWHVWRRMRGAAVSVSRLQPWDSAIIPAKLQVEAHAKCCHPVWREDSVP